MSLAANWTYLYVIGMTSAPPEIIRSDARPPIETDAAPASGDAEVAGRPPIRITALPRPWIEPLLLAGTPAGHAPDDPAVRRFWTAVIGPGAVADLLRLTAAARTGRRIRRPIHLPVLLREGLAHWNGSRVLIHRSIPPLAATHRIRLSPALRAEYTHRFPELIEAAS